jgi:transposase InsO family protein
VKYALITRCRQDFKLRLMCRVLQVSSSGYYKWRQQSPSLHAIADEALMSHLWTSYAASNGTYGAPRVHRDLRDQGIAVGKKRVARLMREHGLVGRASRRRRVVTTDSTHEQPIAPNLLARQFDVTGVGGVNRVWVSDITYIPTHEGWLYLAVVLDLASRRVVGWAMRETLQAELALSALQMAVSARQPAPGLVHHSDRGIQYACHEYRERLTAHGFQASMSRRGNCWDNAVAESFFATLELELIVRSAWDTHDDARVAVFQFIESWYNRRRRHSTLGYISPAAYEEQLQAAA